MPHRGHGNGSRLHFTVGSYQLLDRPESATAEFAGNSVGTRNIRIDNTYQADRFTLLRQLVIDAGVVTSKSAHADHRNVDGIVSQPLAPVFSLRTLRSPLRTLRSRA